MPAARHPHRGFGLVELIVTLAVATIVLGWIAPSMLGLLAALEADRRIHAVRGAVAIARAHAITERTPVTICPLDAGGRCNGDWSAGYAVFRDPDRRARLGTPDRLLRQFGAVSADTRLALRAFRTRRYFRLLPTGMTDWQNGRFVYCPPAAFDLDVRILTINVQGRARLRTAPADDACVR